ncbi:MAG: hypothetical protein NZ554_12880, partial [Bryobacteraceae bacterium]|nr:hypothetical protein [Bryobacteraceae bacterium]
MVRARQHRSLLRIHGLRALGWLGLAPALALAQSPALVATRIYVEDPCGRARATFWVDGTPYNGPVTLFWPEGSKHILSIPAVQEIAAGIRCTATGWVGVHRDREEAKSDGLTIAVTAHRDVTAYKATGQLDYRLTLQIVSPGTLPAFDCTQGPRYGKIYVNGQCFATSAELWIPADSEVLLQAYPPEGFVFSGWQPDLGASTAFQSKFRMNRPLVLSANFAPAVRVTLETEPPELELLADRTRVRTPITLDWAEGSRHTLAPVSPQMDSWGRWWVFHSWSNGQPEQHTYIAGRANVPERVTARFVRAAHVSLLTEPPGLKLIVDGRDNWPSLNFLWGVGTTHQVAAPAEQDFAGRRWAFAGWSHGGPAVQSLTVPEAAAEEGLRLVARYQLLGRLRILSAYQVPVQLNGSSCRTPCLLDVAQGSLVRLRAQPLVELDEWRRLEFTGWADQAEPERLWTAGPNEDVLTVNYQPAYRVLALVAPAEAATVRFEPPSADGFYPAGATLRLVAEPRPGFRFKLWDGDVPGATPELSLAVSEPRIVRAVLERIPYVPPSGVRNAAGLTPETAVAPGSLIAIYGVHLAPRYEAGPDSPLAQSLAGVTVALGERLLPLRFVSPEQINAQLFSDVSEGEHRLLVRQPEREPLEVPFRVARNAPGLFEREEGGRALALAFHEDGSLVGWTRPARRGALVTLWGTGFGPYRRPVPDGFAVPEGLLAELQDETEVLVGERLLRPLWAGAAPGQAGIVALRLRLPADLPPGPLTLTARS